MTLDLTTLSNREVLSAVYIGYYNRAADAAGMQFWEGVVDNTSLNLTNIATEFSTAQETLDTHAFFADPTSTTPSTFITSLYQNLFNRDPDEAGLTFWSEQLQNAIDGVEGSFSVGEIIIKIIEGAQNVDGGTQDLTTILNKIEVAQDWTNAAEAAGDDFDADSMASAKAIIADVTDSGDTVVAAKSEIAEFFAPEPVEGDTLTFTAGTDNLTGTENNDTFEGYLQQNPFAGGVSNGLSSADRADGGAGYDKLYAELVSEFVGGVSGTENIDIQARLSNIQSLEFEARDIASNSPFNLDVQDLAATLSDTFGGFLPFVGPVTEQLISTALDGWQRDIVVDAKNITDHEYIGSSFSDGDLMIENVTTLTSGGGVRNTADITIGMDHTDNANSDGDASDMVVYFDEDYLIAGQAREGQVFYHLLDEDAELAGNPNRLAEIDIDGIRFTIENADGSTTDVTVEHPDAQTAGTHQGFVNALQAPLQALIADGTLPVGTVLVLDPTNVDTTFLDNGTESGPIPAIVLITGDGSPVEATGFSRVENAIGEFDIYGRFGEVNEVNDEPVSINIDLFKAGRGGEGGNLVIGGKDQTEAGDGIEVFHINVKGDGEDAVVDQPSNVGTITSTNNALREIYISTDPDNLDNPASLTIRDGFNEKFDGDSQFGLESGDLQLVNADAHRGDLLLGTDEQIINLDTLTAQGGGDVTFNAWLNGLEEDQAYSYTTGGGEDNIDVEIDGSAVDFAGSSLNILSGGGDDNVSIDSDISQSTSDNEQLNQNILDNIMVDTGDGDDVYRQEDVLNSYVMTGAGNDTIYSGDNNNTKEAWALNFDAVREAAGPDLTSLDDGSIPGEQISLAYIGGATITVTLSGAGVDGGLFAGGGVMALDGTGLDGDDLASGANAGNDGYESSVTIGNLLNGNTYFGDQRDVNLAVMEAINDDDVLSKLLVATEGSNNTVVVTSLVPGRFEDVDLRIDINQRDAADANYANAVLSEAREVFSNSALVSTDLFPAVPGPYGSATAVGADLWTDSAATDAWYDGLSEASDTAANAMDAGVGEGQSNTFRNGSEDSGESDSVFNGGAGDDLIVLSTDASPGSTPFTVSSNNALINFASNETVVMTGLNFGNDTIMNFTTVGDVDLGPITAPFADPANGDEAFDFLDFTSYLTSQYDSSTNPPGTDSADSNILIPVTLNYNEDADMTAGGTGDGSTDTDVEANEVAVVRMVADTADSETFGGLTSGVVENLFNNDGTFTGFGGDSSYGDMDAANFSVADYDTTGEPEALIGDAKAIFMVENAANLGEYKVFELTWDGDDTDLPDSLDVSAVSLGSLDFGDSLSGLDDINLVGSEDYAALLTFGFA